MVRLDWWNDELPETCSEGHPYAAGANLSWEPCPGCPGAKYGDGHHVVFCRINSCRAEPARPPGHVGGGYDQRSMGGLTL